MYVYYVCNNICIIYTYYIYYYYTYIMHTYCILNTFLYAHKYIYIYIYIYTHTHAYTCIHTSFLTLSLLIYKIRIIMLNSKIGSED